MLTYHIDPCVEAFSTEISDPPGFPVVLPLHQAHGTESRLVTPDTAAGELTGVDALFTRTPGLRIGVKTADCVPILLYDPESRTVAAIHSGWKGTVANIIAETVRHMITVCGFSAVSAKAVIGPCIHLGAFEVGDEVMDRFARKGYRSFCCRLPRPGTQTGEKWHVDLPAICRAQLERCGVTEVEVRPECTYSLHHRFYSARRLGSSFDRQRMINAIRLI